MLAIVIPYYKLTFFEETLQSLANQTDKRFKVYIGDDASPENPQPTLEKFKGKFDFVYHRFETNLGGASLTEQWERCIGLTDKESWVMILGDDDSLSSNAMASFYENLLEINSKDIKVIRFSTIVINENGDAISEIYNHPKIETPKDFLNRKFSKKTRSSLSEYIFDKNLLSKVKFVNFPLAWHSDDLVIMRVGKNGIYSINDSFLSIRTSTLSITGSKQNRLLKADATLQFILNYIFRIKQITNEAQHNLERKAEHAIFDLRNINYFARLCFYYLTNRKIYKFLRLIYFYIKKSNRWRK